jgi:hypothetical protein
VGDSVFFLGDRGGWLGESDGEGVVFEVISRFGEALDEHDDAIAICLAHFGKGRHDSPGAAGAEGPEGAAEIGLEGELA